MDNFNLYFDDRVPQFLSKSVLKKKTKLSVCDFIFQKNHKLNQLNTRKKSLSNLPISSNSTRKQPRSPLISQHNIKQKPIITKQTCTQGHQNVKQQIQEIKQFQYIKYKSQQKLPTVFRCNIQLDSDQINQDKFIRVKKQIPKARLSKMFGHFREVSQRNQIVRLKQEQKHQNNEQINQLIKQESQQNKKPPSERCYFIKNLIINANSSQVQTKQKAHMHLLVNKLKQTERRGKFKINLIQRKHYQQISPVQLKTNRINYQQIQKNTLKQKIMKKFTKQLTKNKNSKKQFKKKEKFQDLVTAWPFVNQQNIMQQDNQGF